MQITGAYIRLFDNINTTSSVNRTGTRTFCQLKYNQIKLVYMVV